MPTNSRILDLLHGVFALRFRLPFFIKVSSRAGVEKAGYELDNEAGYPNASDSHEPVKRSSRR
jgi:hypothetical protein